MPLWPFRRTDNKTPPPQDVDSRVLSILTPAEARALNGLPVEAIAGTVAVGDEVRPDSFRVNPRFVQFMHEVLRETGPLDPGLKAAARAQGDGWIYIIDLRTAEGVEGSVPPEDIIAGFEVHGGAIVASSYWANDDHRVFSARGLVTLPPSLRAAFLARLAAVPPRA
jgi:hypothetical protein